MSTQTASFQPHNNSKQSAVRVNTVKTEYSWEYFNEKNLRFEEPVRKDIPKEFGSGSYYNIEISYNYGTPDAPNYKKFKLEGPVEHAPYGVGEKIDPKNNKTNYSMFSRFDNQTHLEYKKVILRFYYCVCKYLVSKAEIIGMNSYGLDTPDFDFSAKFSEIKPCPGVKCPIYVPQGSVDQETQDGQTLRNLLQSLHGWS